MIMNYKMLSSAAAILISALTFAENKPELDLSQYEYSVYSQQGEDGVIAKIFEIIGTSSKYCVEFGASNGHYLSNTKRLRELENWQCLLMDCAFDDASINLHKEWITPDNINELFEKYNVPFDLDFLSIDIDGNDFYVWNAISKKYQPRLICIETNAKHKPHEDRVIIFNPNHFWDGTDYFGASILAYYNLGRKKGYSLVYCEKAGINLFFLRDDLVANCPYSFKNINNVGNLYTGPYLHKDDPQRRPYVTSESLLK